MAYWRSHSHCGPHPELVLCTQRGSSVLPSDNLPASNRFIAGAQTKRKGKIRKTKTKMRPHLDPCNPATKVPHFNCTPAARQDVIPHTATGLTTLRLESMTIIQARTACSARVMRGYDELREELRGCEILWLMYQKSTAADASAAVTGAARSPVSCQITPKAATSNTATAAAN